MTLPHIVIVGAGAGGLELATQLGDTLGKNQQAIITLVDIDLTHIWKPLWHEIAAGTLTTNEDELNYIVHAYHHHFRFQLGSLVGLDRAHQKIMLGAVLDVQNQEIFPQRTLEYDTLVIAIGSISNDFNIPGVKEHCAFLDCIEDCKHFHQQFLTTLMQLQEKTLTKVDIAIIGGGATGVELAAELQFACQQALQYKKNNPTPQIEICVIESAARVLSSLPEEISLKTQDELKRRGIQVFTNEKVTSIDEKNIYTQSNHTIPASLKLWAAGIKGPEILNHLGLKVNNRSQLLVKQTLQTIEDENIFAFGDCASCPQPGTTEPVPPRAQAAHQQAALLVKSLKNHLQGKPLQPYVYQDYGSLITLSHSRTIGGLMGKMIGNVLIEGKIARLVYRFLYRRHQAALYGWWRVMLLVAAEFLTQTIRPRLKLH